jgi:hypothetical protein
MLMLIKLSFQKAGIFDIPFSFLIQLSGAILAQGVSHFPYGAIEAV